MQNSNLEMIITPKFDNYEGLIESAVKLGIPNSLFQNINGLKNSRKFMYEPTGEEMGILKFIIHKLKIEIEFTVRNHFDNSPKLDIKYIYQYFKDSEEKIFERSIT